MGKCPYSTKQMTKVFLGQVFKDGKSLQNGVLITPTPNILWPHQEGREAQEWATDGDTKLPNEKITKLVQHQHIYKKM